MKVAVFGAGTMGLGIAQVFAGVDDFEVILCSSSIESANKGKAKLEKQLQSRVLKGKMLEEDMGNILDRICIGDISACCEADLVVEAIPENLEKKRDLFKQLDIICKDECIFASNTSSLPISEIGYGLTKSVVGLHFFNPAPVMKLVEIVRTLTTPDTIVDTINQVAEKVGKTPVVVQENPGFIVNRILIPMINEAVGLVETGIATVEDIDTAMKLGANHPMGPLALGDLIGLDVCLAIMETLYNETGDPKYRPSVYLKKMVRNGMLGRKSSQGFYKY